jgi:epsin
MDFNSLKDQVSNLTLYDLKAGVRKVQNGMHVKKDESRRMSQTDSIQPS